MLILSRRVGDAIVIEGGIKVVVLACERGGVRLGFEAPPEVSILREEIVTQIASENRRAHATASARPLVGLARPAGPVAAPVPAPALPAGATAPTE
jgi:carbon storage regulator